MVALIYRSALNTLKEKPVRLWGISLLSSLITILILAFGILPIITIPVTLTLSAGMSVIYLNGFKGREVSSEQLFAGFKNFAHVAGGMCWKKLWILIWALVPIAGIVFAVIKSLSYAFVPYILIERPEISATEALKYSMKKTNGLKLKMFIAWILPIAAVALVSLALSLLGLIPFVGIAFQVIRVIFTICYSAVMPLFLGLILAGFYNMA